jgi:hypothetical protein
MRPLTILSALAGIALLLLPIAAPQAVWADDDNDVNKGTQAEDITWSTSYVEGIVYKIEAREGAQVVTIFDKQVTDGGLSIDVYLRDPNLTAQVRSGAVCVGKWIHFDGIRTSISTLDAQGLWIDPSSKCGTPPGAKS